MSDPTVSLHHGDCLEAMAAMDAESVDAIVADPPYNIGKAAWDKVDDYLAWSEAWIAEASRVLRRNGAFWCFHSKPLVLAQLSGVITKHGRGLRNWVTWDKYNGSGRGVQYRMNRSKIGRPEGNEKRTFDGDAEYAVYHADEDDWTKRGAALWSGDFDHKRTFIFAGLRDYLVSERDRAGWTTQSVAEQFQRKTGSRTVTGMARHWFSHAQWTLPTRANYEWLRDLFNGRQPGDYLRREYEDLRREYEDRRPGYEDLRREYEDLRREYLHLRYTFHNPGKVSSVWQFPPAKPNGHPTPKPIDLMRRIVTATTNPGDLVLDPFCGSGTTGVACVMEGREFVGIEQDADYVEISRRRIASHRDQMQLAAT